MKFNTQLINLRKLFGYNQKDFSSTVKISQKNISSWEQGKTEPFYKDLKKIANLFDISLVYLVEGKCITENDEKVDKRLNDYLKNNSKSLQFEYILLQAKQILGELDIKEEKYLPTIDKKNEINFKYFKEIKGKLILDKEKVVSDKDLNLYKKAFIKEATLRDAVKLDDCGILDFAIKNHSEAIKQFDLEIFNAKDDDTRKQTLISKNHYSKNNSLNYCLENLPKEMKNYFKFIVILIDNGAFYEKQVGAGDKMTTFKYVKDVSRTNFIYKIAKMYI